MLTALNLSPSKLHTPLDVLEGEKWEGASIGAAVPPHSSFFPRRCGAAVPSKSSLPCPRSSVADWSFLKKYAHFAHKVPILSPWWKVMILLLMLLGEEAYNRPSKIRQSLIYYAGSLWRLCKWIVEQASVIPSIIFFHDFLQNTLQNAFQFISLFFL